MSVLILHFKISANEDYSDLYSLIRDFHHLPLSDSCYLIHTNLTPKEIHLQLLPFLKSDDNLFIFRITSPYHLHAQKKSIRWILKKFDKYASYVGLLWVLDCGEAFLLSSQELIGVVSTFTLPRPWFLARFVCLI